ncbi:MAG: hypothetical protein IKI93_07090, partial [Clostridia bacterium]|nr:hypothetical protein [Clostridia bacterium]
RSADKLRVCCPWESQRSFIVLISLVEVITDHTEAFNHDTSKHGDQILQEVTFLQDSVLALIRDLIMTGAVLLFM